MNKKKYKSNIFLNSWHIYNPNGMLYYSIDYINRISSNTNIIFIVRNKKNKEIVRKNLKRNNIKIIICSKRYYLYIYLKMLILSIFKNHEIFTPSTHPLPFLNNQKIVVHDSYPFRKESIIKFLKFYFLKIMLLISNTNIVYINHYDSKNFSKEISNFFKIQKGRLLYIPNKVERIENFTKQKRLSFDKLILGLPGTDSDKKDYEKLFDNLLINKVTNLEFIIFGFRNKYIDKLESKYPFKIKVIDSSQNNLKDFLKEIDYIINTSRDEGYCRPIAYATQSGIPLLSIDSQVMREFYDDCDSLFFNSYKELSMYILKHINS